MNKPFTTDDLLPAEAKAIKELIEEFKAGERAAGDVLREMRSLLGVQRTSDIVDQFQKSQDVSRIKFLDPSDDPNLDDSDEVIVCEVCKQGLRRLSTDGDEVWVHGRNYGRFNHDPVPRAIPRSQHQNTECDYCGQFAVLHWKFVGDRVRAQTGPQLNDFGTVWASCETCSELIFAGDLDALVTRVLRVSPTLGKGLDAPGMRTMRSSLKELWTKFFATVYERVYIGPQREPARLHARMMPKLQNGLVKFWRQPGLADLLASHRASTGKIHSIPGVHCGDEDRFSVQFQPDAPMPRQVWANHVNHLTAGIEGSDLYWISEDFTQLAIAAGKDFETLSITREQLPSPFGFMVYDSPIFEIKRPHGSSRVRAITWTLVPGGIWIALYIQGEDGDPTVDVESMRAEMGWLMCPNTGGGIAFHDEIAVSDAAEGGSVTELLCTVFATWFLMNQPGVAESQAAPVDKKYARSFQRAHGRRLPDVQLVDLRRRAGRPKDNAEHREGRQLTVRLYRKGHWKNVAYGPKHGLRRQQYISPYIAGPEDAPFKARRPTVKVLR